MVKQIYNAASNVHEMVYLAQCVSLAYCLNNTAEYLLRMFTII